MAQATLTPEGQTADTSATVSIPSGATYVFGLFTTGAASIPANAYVDIVAVTPGATRLICQLTGNGKPTAVAGPVDVKAIRPSLAGWGVNVGVYYNT